MGLLSWLGFGTKNNNRVNGQANLEAALGQYVNTLRTAGVSNNKIKANFNATLGPYNRVIKALAAPAAAAPPPPPPPPPNAPPAARRNWMRMLRRAPKPTVRSKENLTKNLNKFNSKLRAALLSLNQAAVTNFNKELTQFNNTTPKSSTPNMVNFEERLARLKQKRNAILKLQTAANNVRAKSNVFRNHASRLNKSNTITNANRQTLNALYTSLNQNNQNLYENVYKYLKNRPVTANMGRQPNVPPPPRPVGLGGNGGNGSQPQVLTSKANFSNGNKRNIYSNNNGTTRYARRTANANVFYRVNGNGTQANPYKFSNNIRNGYKFSNGSWTKNTPAAAQSQGAGN